MNLELTDIEREFLLSLLQDRLGELKEEIHHSRVADFTARLKTTEQCVRGLIAKLGADANA